MQMQSRRQSYRLHMIKIAHYAILVEKIKRMMMMKMKMIIVVKSISVITMTVV